MVIYQITNIVTSDFYIGKTKNPKERFYKHKYLASNNKSKTYLHRAMRKYGVKNFVFNILEEVQQEKELDYREIFWIEKLSPKYNMTKGGDGGDTSSSPNYKLSILKRDQSGEKNGMFGKKRQHSEKTKKLLSIKGKGKNSCPVSCEGMIFDSVGEAQSAFLGISIRKRLDNEKYPTFFRLRPKTVRK